MGLLSTSAIQSLFGGVFSGIYEDGVLRIYGMDRQDNGTLKRVLLSEHPVKIQFDAVTERMRSSPGYSSTDQRCIVLRHGLALDWIDTDAIVHGQSKVWALHEVTTDPARSYFEARASLLPGETDE